MASKPFLTIAAVSALIVSLPLSAHALRIYRCNGKIQYLPCQQNSTSQEERGLLSASPVKSKYAKVIRSDFSTLPKQEGIWRGLIAGNGTVHLRLLIKRNGSVHSSRYMGNVALNDRSTTFAFRSVVPAGKDWSWDIVAYNG